MAVALAGSMGISSARAQGDPPVELWRQQMFRPGRSVSVQDAAGHMRKFMYVNIDGYAVTQGDINLGTVADVARGRIHFPGVPPLDIRPPVPPKPAREPRRRTAAGCPRTPVSAGTPNAAALWPTGQVPYVFDPALPPSVRDTVTRAMADFTAGTCIRFVPRTDESAHLRIFSGTGCYSYLGRTGAQQDLSLGRGCDYKGTAIHELMHAVGFYHEHNRSDRDAAVTVNFQNVNPAYWSQFQKMMDAQNRLFGEFDQNSVMIYGNKAFSANGQDTLVARDGRRLTEPYEKQELSAADIAGVRALYGC
jgi:Notch-like protein